MKTVRNVFVQVIEKPQRKVLIKRGVKATDYFAYCEAIGEVQASIAKYAPAIIDAQWDTSNPRIQLELIGTRGYIELIPIK